MAQKKVKKKLNIKGLILILLFVYIIGMFFYTFIKMPIKNIYILNTNLLTDNEVIEVAGLKEYPPFLKVNTKDVKEKVANLDLVSDVKVKKSLDGKITIDIQEAYPLFYNRQKELVVLSNKKEVANSNRYLGIPTLINNVPSNIYNDLIEGLTKVDSDLIKMINEIEYNPDMSGDIMIDENRFLLRMNDTNIVYINTLNIERLNNYKSFFASIEDKRGTLYLDSYDSRDDLLGLFTPFEGPIVNDDGGNEDGSSED